MAQRMNLMGIASYPHLDKPRAVGRPGQQQGDPKYSMVVILDDSTDFAALDAAMKAEAQATFPNGWPNTGHWPLKQYGEGDNVAPELVGKYYINASSSEFVPVVDHQVMPIPLEKISSEVYPGCRVVANVAFAGYNNVQKGVGCYLNGVQKVGDGPRLDNKPTVSQMFTAVPVSNAAGYDPGAFPQGTPQNPGPQAPVTGAPATPPQAPVTGAPATPPQAPATGAPAAGPQGNYPWTGPGQ